MAKSGAERTREWRARQNSDIGYLRIRYHTGELPDALIMVSRLSRRDADDPDKIAQALEAWIAAALLSRLPRGP